MAYVYPSSLPEPALLPTNFKLIRRERPNPILSTVLDLNAYQNLPNTEMKPFSSFITALSLSVATFSHADSAVPTRLFTVSTYQLEYPPGVAITGYNMTARNGHLYLSPKANGKSETWVLLPSCKLMTHQSRKQSYSSARMEEHIWYDAITHISLPTDQVHVLNE